MIPAPQRPSQPERQTARAQFARLIVRLYKRLAMASRWLSRSLSLITGAGRRWFATNHGPRPFIWIALVAIVALSLVGALGAMNGYSQYTRARSSAQAGMVHLRRVEAILSPLLAHPMAPDVRTLDQIHAEFDAAEHDFAITRQNLGAGAMGAAAAIPRVGGTISDVSAMAVAADDFCLAGLEITSGLKPVVAALAQGSLLAPQAGATAPHTPVLTQAMFDGLTAQFERAVQRLNAAIDALHGVDLSSLPTQIATPQQIAQLKALVKRWPAISANLAMVDAWLRLAPTLLGVRQPERFLVEIMDRAEMRPTGGFIGAYGVMTLQQGAIQPFSLGDIFALDLPYIQHAGYPSAPAMYPWWPFNGYALRDSNLSPDFPTAAHAGIALLKQEGGPDVQGVIALNAVTIERLLKIIGPVQVDDYHVTVTDNNLESLIRRYTETNAMRDGNDLPVGDQLTTIHERFTAILGRELMNKVRALPHQQDGAVAQALLKSMSMKDMQVYLDDPAAQALVARLGFDGALAHGVEDAVTIVDANIGANKANTFTKVNYSDTVTLDAQGTATHHLTVTYRFDSSSNPGLYRFLYHRDYYLTYLRIYAQQNAHLISSDGFSSGASDLGHSDEPGHQMWAGLVKVQDGVAYTLHFVWSTQGAAIHDAQHNHWIYTLDYQHQSGSSQSLTLQVTSPGAQQPLVTYNSALSKDTTFNVIYQ